MTSIKAKIAKYIGTNHRRLFFKLLYRASKSYNNFFNNKNDDHHTNGEFWLMKRLSASDMGMVFDAGANKGLWTTQARKTFPNAQIHTFEPIPAIFEKLRSITHGFINIHPVNSALSDFNGDITFSYYPDNDYFSTIFNRPDGGKKVLLQCRCVNGDTYCCENGIDQIDFLKIDTEGAEMYVLRGFSEMLKKRKIRVIQFEYNALSILSHFLLRDFYLFFEQFGYQLGKLHPLCVEFAPYHWDREDFIGPNYVAIQTDDKQLLKHLS